MKKFFSFLFLFIAFSFLVPQNVFCEDNTEPEPYSKEEFPQWALDLRRFEIVSLGSIPFAMIGVTLIYGSYEKSIGNYSSVPNPLNPSSLDESEQLKILGMTVCTGLAIGLVDTTVNLLIRYNKRKRQEKIDAAKLIKVVPLTEPESPEEVPADEESNIDAEAEKKSDVSAENNEGN